MSTHKTTADQSLILSFLEDTFSKEVSNFEVISGGEGSQAYSFDVNDEEYIIRINKHQTLGFRKDEFVFNHYASLAIPIPKIHKIGKINSDLRFCISERVKGKVLGSFSLQELEILRPSIFEVLDAIHATDISETKGYGKWDADGKGEAENWKDYLLTVDKYAKGEAGGPSLFETTFLEKDFWDIAYSRLSELTVFCPEERFLVHSDYGSNNVLSDGHKITGVIDWESSRYGDFLYDVAWLSFWSKTLDFQNLYIEHIEKKNIKIENFHERILCYKLYIGLGSMSFFAYSGQKDKYDSIKQRTLNLLID